MQNRYKGQQRQRRTMRSVAHKSSHGPRGDHGIKVDRCQSMIRFHDGVFVAENIKSDISPITFLIRPLPVRAKRGQDLCPHQSRCGFQGMLECFEALAQLQRISRVYSLSALPSRPFGSIC